MADSVLIESCADMLGVWLLDNITIERFAV